MVSAPPAGVFTLPVAEYLAEGQPPVSELNVSDPGTMLVMVPLASRFEIAGVLAGVYLHVTLIPKISPWTSKDDLMMLSVVDVMLGSVPAKEEYWRCQGSVSVFALPLPASHVPTVTELT